MNEWPLDSSDSYRHPGPPRGRLVAAIVTPEDAPRECTLYPPDEPDEVVITTWMTAREGSFLSLEDAR